VLITLPTEYLGHRWANVVEARNACAVAEVGDFVKSKIGAECVPDNDVDWLTISEEQLFELSHCVVFHDGPGEASRRIKSMANYPEDVWKKRMVKTLQELWIWKVRHVQRALQRKDIVTAQLLWGKFCEYAMKAGFLLNHEYAPYDKWRYVQFLKLPEFGQQVGALIRAGLNDANQMGEVAQQIQTLYTQRLNTMGFNPIEIPNSAYEEMELQSYALAIQNTIENQEILQYPRQNIA